MSEELYLHQNIAGCDLSTYFEMSIYHISNVTAGYERFSDLIAFFGSFHIFLDFHTFL